MTGGPEPALRSEEAQVLQQLLLDAAAVLGLNHQHAPRGAGLGLWLVALGELVERSSIMAKLRRGQLVLQPP